MGSMQSSVSSFVSTTAASLRRSEALGGSQGRLNSYLGTGNLSRGPEKGVPSQPSFELAMGTPELSLVLWYSSVRLYAACLSPPSSPSALSSPCTWVRVWVKAHLSLCMLAEACFSLCELV